MNEPWVIHLLGGLRVVSSERIITRFRTQKTAALLAYMAYHRGRSHVRDLLIEMFWPDSEQESGRHSLSLALSSLRNQLEPPGVSDGAVIIADRYSVELNPVAFTTDVHAFEGAVRLAAQARNAPNRLTLFADALDRYTGQLLPGFYDDWITPEQERLAQRYLQTSTQFISLLEKEGQTERALEIAHCTVARVPLYEDGQRELIRLLAATGQFDSAIRQYRELTRLLHDELGELPQRATTDLVNQIENRVEAEKTAFSGTERRPDIRIATRTIPSPHPAALPTGTVSFLLTEIAGASGLSESDREAFRTALSIHHALLRREFRRVGGVEVKDSGHSFRVAFVTATDALDCAVSCQRALSAQDWPVSLRSMSGGEPMTLQVRMAIHTGDAELDDGEYHSHALLRGAQMIEAAHGGQVLCSDTTAALLRRDLEPEIRLRDLGIYRLKGIENPERLFQVDYPGMARRDFPPPAAEAALTAKIPLQFTRFIGREQELDRLEEMLHPDRGHVRLVTLTGPGGTGKTRLAVEAAGRMIEAFNGAIWFVPLSEIVDSRVIMDSIAATMALPLTANAGPLDRVREALSKQRSLLVLDNLEQLVMDAGASRGSDAVEEVKALLESLPDLSILSTSRALLGLPGEHEFVVPPLRTPGGNESPHGLGMFESVTLFVDRAQAVKPDFRVTNQNAAAVAELCDRLEGLPLAIELAAARAQVLTPVQMLAQLSKRFEFLVSRKRGVAERQRTLRAAVDWSYRLLAPDLQRFFARLSVFRGGWSVEAAEEVCDEPLALDFLAQLRECSLVLTEERGSEIRFRLLEMLREYAAERLTVDEQESAAHRHRRYYLDLATQSEAELTGPDPTEWLNRLDAELDNFRTALAIRPALSLKDHQAEIGTQVAGIATRLSLTVSLSRFWSIRGHSREGRRAVAELLAHVPRDHNELGESLVRARALGVAGSLAHDCGDLEPAGRYLEECVTGMRDLKQGGLLAEALNLSGNVALDSNDPVRATEYYDEAFALYRAAGDPRGIAMVLSNLAVTSLEQEDYSEAARLMDDSLRIKRRLGNPHALAIAMENLGNLRIRLEEFDVAGELHAEALDIRREIGHKQGIAMSLNNLAYVKLKLHDVDAAAEHLSESIKLFHELGDPRGLSEALVGAAGVLAARRKQEQCANLLGAAGTLDSAHQDAQNAEARRLAADATKSLGEKRFEKAVAAGRAWSAADAVERALALLASDSA